MLLFQKLIQPKVVGVAAIVMAWLGCFLPWFSPVPAALNLSGYDLVEWLTFAIAVRDGTFPVSRVDMLLPLAGLSLLCALSISLSGKRVAPMSLKAIPVILLHSAPALFAAFLILPAYPFVLSAHAEAELRPQLLLGLGTAILATGAAVLAHTHRRLAQHGVAVVAAASVVASWRAYALARPAIDDILLARAPMGVGIVLTIIGFALIALNALRTIRQGAK